MAKHQNGLHAMTRRHVLSSCMGAGFAALALTFTLSITTMALAQDAAVFEGQDKWLFPGWERTGAVNQAAVDANLELIALANKALATKKVSLVVMIVPAKALVERDKLPVGHEISQEAETLYARLENGLQDRGVVAVNLAPALAGLPDDQQAFFRTDYHWTPWAAEAAAKTTADLISGKWQLAGNAGDGAKLGEWTKERRFGDLAANFLTADQRNAIGREVFTVRKEVAASGGAGLLDDSAAPVHVVGNSFVQPYLGFSQALSHDLDRRVTLTWNPGDVGPWATMLQYLESDDFSKSPAPVVVWQFNEGQMQQGPSATGQWIASSIMPVAAWTERLQKAVAK